MARHNIGATSTLCGAAGHTWKPGLAANYRECLQCRTVEVCKDGQWVSPTGRSRKSSTVADGPAPLIQGGQPVLSVSELRAILTSWAVIHQYPVVHFQTHFGQSSVGAGESSWAHFLERAESSVLAAVKAATVEKEVVR